MRRLGLPWQTFLFVLLLWSSRVRGGNIGIGRTGGGAWLAWCSGGRGNKLGNVRILTIPPHLSLIGSVVFGGVRGWIAMPFTGSGIVQWTVSVELGRGG